MENQRFRRSPRQRYPRDETGRGTRSHLQQGREDLPFVVTVVDVLMHDLPVPGIDFHIDV